MSDKVEKALELFDSGFNCSQAVIGAFSKELGVDEQVSMKFAGGFGSGLRSGEVCGAVSGATMAIGLKYGQYIANDKASKEKCSQITLDFMEEYRRGKGTVLCRELLGYDVRDAKSGVMSSAKRKEVCRNAIETAVLLLEEMGF